MRTDPDSFDAKLAGVAVDQQSQITTKQLLRLGASSDMITTRVQRGTLFRQHFGVFSVGRPATTPREKASAAVLACGADSALGLRSALAHWELIKEWPAVPQVMSLHRRRRPGIEVHRAKALDEDDVTEHHGITTTKPARAMLDVAPTLSDDELDNLVTNALHTLYLKVGQLQDICEKYPDHPGAARLEPFWNTSEGPVRSGWERQMKRFRQEYDFPTMVINTVVNGREADAYIPEARLVVELDGWPSHRSPKRFEDDRERDADNLDADIETIRLTYKRYKSRPGEEAARIHRIAARRKRTLATVSRM